MTTYTITGLRTSSFGFHSPYTTLSITTTGYIDTPTGIAIDAGSGTKAYAVINDGKVAGNVYLGDGGVFTNGGDNDPSAQVVGYNTGVSIRNAVGTVVNYGAIDVATLGNTEGVYLSNGGVLTNGSGVDTTALIRGAYGAFIRNAVGTVANFGTIEGTGTGGGNTSGLYVSDGGKITNGSNIDTMALIEGAGGIEVRTGAATVVNFGSIESVAAVNPFGVDLQDGGILTNGSSTDQTALVEGYGSGASIRGATSTVVNFGTIEGKGAGQVAVYLGGGGLTNGASGDHGALIDGNQGVEIGSSATVANFGTILGTGDSGYGLELRGGGALTNGAVNDGSALIAGYNGVDLDGATTAVNFGTISGTGASAGWGAVLEETGADLVNGAANHTGALIEGYVGAGVYGADTLTNYGTISGANGVAVNFANASATLVAEAGSVFDGQVLGGGGFLALGAGVGTLSGVTGGDVTVSGFMPTTTFQDFGGLDIDAGAQFTLSGNFESSALGLDIYGSLSAAGTVDPNGLVVSGTLAGAGTLTLGAGTQSLFEAGTVLSIAKVTVSGATTAVSVGVANLTYAGAWTQTAGTLSVATGDRINFSGSSNGFSGTLTGAGTVAFTGGADTLAAATLSATTQIINTATVTLSGAITLSSTLTATTTNLIVAAAGATLTGGGALSFTNLATNSLHGAGASATLTNVNDRILGAGLLGGGEMILVNQSGGVIDGNDALALTINTGANTIANAGLIEATGAGGVIVDSAVASTGKLYADGGVLTLDGAVTGAGTGYVNGGTLDAASTFTENVTFLGTTGVLELAHSQTYTGDITDFSKTGATSLDLADITFTAGTTKATYSGTATSGVLTVTDGTHTAKITLEGNYTTSTFTTSSDGHGGTKIVDPTAPTQGHAINPTPLHAFVQAMAGMGAEAMSPVAAPTEIWRTDQVALAPPRSALV